MDLINLKNYKIKSPLGSGAFGRVFLVKNKKDKNKYAAKISNIPLKDKKEQEENIKLISREVNILSKIYHPAILKFHGFSPKDFDGNPFPTFIIEYAINDNLKSILNLERNGLAPAEWDDTKKYLNLYGIAYGMSFLHKNNIIHRDLKPENIMEDEYLLPKIGDFSLSKIFDPDQKSKQSMVEGTLYYMAPEMFTEDHYSNSIDVYAYSIILFEILTGQEPYTEISNPSMIQMNNYRPKFPKGLTVSDQMMDLISRCWDSNPGNRPTFSQIVETLKDPNFIENSGFTVDENDLLIYQEYLEAEMSSFNSNKTNILNIENFIKDKNKSSIKRVIIGEDSSLFSKNKQENTKAQTDIKAVKSRSKDDDDDHNTHKKSEEEEAVVKDRSKNKIYPTVELNKLDKKNQELVQKAEQGDDDSIVLVAVNLIEGKNSFPKSYQLGIKYLNLGIDNKNVECMEIYGRMLLEGKTIPLNEQKAIEILTNAANKYDSDISRIFLCKNILSKEKNLDEEINYFLAKKYMKEASDNGNTEAIILYGKLCEKSCNNKYGKVEQNFKEAFDYYKMAHDRGDLEGTALYSKYLEFPHGLFTPEIKQAVNLAKMAADKGNETAILSHAIHLLNGTCIQKDYKEAFKLIKKGVDKEIPNYLCIYGLCLYNGYYDITKNEEKGLEYIKTAALKGNMEAIYFNAKYSNEKTNLSRINKRLIETGFIFFYGEEDIFGRNFCYEAAVELDKENYNKALDILEPCIEKNYVGCLTLYAIALARCLKKKSEARKMSKRAADFSDINSIRDYIELLEDGSFGSVDSYEANKYKEILAIRDSHNAGDTSKIKIYPKIEYQILNKECQQLVQKAEKGDDKSLILVATNLIEGKNSFPLNVGLGIKYLESGIKSNKFECMEIYGEMLLEGKKVDKNEKKAVEILQKAALNSQSIKSRILLCNNILSKEETEENEINYYQAKKYAKEAADKGNAEAQILYGRLCEYKVNNKYGKVEQNFEEAFNYFKMAYEQDYPDGIAYYALYIEFPRGLFTPNPKEAVKLTKLAADKGSIFAMFRDGVHYLNGTCRPVNYEEGWKLIHITMEKGLHGAYFFHGLANYYGSYGVTKNEAEGLKYIKLAAKKGEKNALYKYALLADKYPEKINQTEIKMKLIEKGYIFDCCTESKFGDDEDITYNAAYELDQKNYNKAIQLLEKGMKLNFMSCMQLYAEVLTTELNKPLEGKRLYKKASDFSDFSSMQDYVKYLEDGSFGRIDHAEAKKYQEILDIYKDFL